MAFVEKLPMDVGGSKNIHPGTLPLPSCDLGAIEPVGTGIRVAQLGVSAVTTLAPSGSIVGVSTGGGVVVGLSTTALFGIGAVLAVAGVAWTMIRNHQAVVKAHRHAREARWQAFYETGIALINEVYGSTEDFDWSHAHNPDEGFGQYYGLGAQFYFWRGGTPRDPNMSDEDFRAQLLSTIKRYGLDPTRIMGYENVALNEELNPRADFVARPEKILTTKEILIGFGYNTDEINRITFKDSLTLFYGAVMIDLPNLKTEQEAKVLMDEIDMFLKVAGLDSAKFFKAANPSSIPDPTGAQSTVSQQPVIIPISSITPTVSEIPPPTGAISVSTTIPVSEEELKVLVAGMPSWGWFLLAGMGISLLLGGKREI